MATIVYDGMEGTGNLFRGMKFFLLQRVPMRQRLIEWVKSNGGEVCPLEKQADIRIADHIRKDCPVGSTSWTFIERSIRNGKLEDIDDHRAGPIAQNTRPVGSKQATKSTRTPFTAEDDRILMDWVVKAERKGLAIKGNEVYEQLEKKNNRHTSQSWRDRWIKHVSLRPRPDIVDDLLSGPDNSSPAKSATRAPRISEPISGARVPPKAGSHDKRPGQLHRDLSTGKVSSKATSPESPTVPWVAKSKGGRLFTRQEIRLLADNHDDIINIDENEEINAWAAWSDTYPNHTPQEWRNFFNNEFSKMIKSKGRLKPSTPSHTSESERYSRVSSSPTIKSSTKPEPVTTKIKSIEKRQLQSSTRTYPKETPRRVEDPLLTDEKQFVAYVKLLAEELDLEVNFKPVICGKRIPLFRLWQVVRADCGGVDEVEGRNLWPRVARSLNISGSQSLEELRSCYNIILPDVEVTREEFWEMTDSQEQAMIESQLRKTAEQQADNMETQISDDDVSDEDHPESDLDPLLPSRQTLVSPSRSNKRSSPTEDGHGFTEETSHNKRQRLNESKEKEISSTPEDRIYSKVRRHLPERSPSRAPVVSPILGENKEGESPKIFFRESDLLGQESIQKHPMYSVEPETQDFQIPIENEEGERAGTNTINSFPSDPYLARRAQQDSEGDSSSQSETESKNEPEILAFVRRCIDNGHTKENIKKCMYATMWDIPMAEEVIEGLKQGLGIPEHVSGVWTSADDQNLFPQSGRHFKAVQKKHGKEKVNARIALLKLRQRS